MITLWKETVSQLLSHSLGEKQREKNPPTQKGKHEQMMLGT